jgi:hypothetical protein
LQPYVPAGGGKKKRLRSKLMVFDLLARMEAPVTRDELHIKFFEYFGLKNMEAFWQRPTNALNTAIDRARDDNLILEIPGEGGAPATYAAGFRDRATGRPAMYSGQEE